MYCDTVFKKVCKCERYFLNWCLSKFSHFLLHKLHFEFPKHQHSFPKLSWSQINYLSAQISCEVERGFFASFGCDTKAAKRSRYALRADALSHVLRSFYSLFRLFHGPFRTGGAPRTSSAPNIGRAPNDACAPTTSGAPNVGGASNDSGASPRVEDPVMLRRRLAHFCARYFDALRLHAWPLMNRLNGVDYMFVGELSI